MNSSAAADLASLRFPTYRNPNWRTRIINFLYYKAKWRDAHIARFYDFLGMTRSSLLCEMSPRDPTRIRWICAFTQSGSCVVIYCVISSVQNMELAKCKVAKHFSNYAVMESELFKPPHPEEHVEVFLCDLVDF